MHARMNPTRPSNDAAMAGAVRARALLIIEDDPPIRRALRNALGDVAERLLEAPTGKTGIDIAATERPDLVILDLGLPDLEGVAVCREIRSWSPVPIVVLSARHSDAEKVRSEEHTSELQSRLHLVCRLLLEKKKKKNMKVL